LKKQNIDQSFLEKLKPMELQPLPENPLVSVLIANYNYGQYIGEAIESVLNQTYQNFEIIICDDGSTDDSRSIIEKLSSQEPRIHAKFQSNQGVAAALNTAFQVSKGQILSLLDADDIFLPEKLEITRQSFLASEKVGLSAHKVIPVDSQRNIINTPIPNKVEHGYNALNIIAKGGDAALPPASGLSFRVEVAQKIFPLPVQIKRGVDSYLRFCASILSEVFGIQKVLAYYRIHNKNITATKTFTRERLESLIQDYQTLYHYYVSFLNHDIKTLRFALEDSEGYRSMIMALALFDGQRLSSFSPWIKKFSSLKLKLIWTFLTILPNKMALSLLIFWWSDSRTKRVIKKLMI